MHECNVGNPVVVWLLGLSLLRAWVQSPVGELRSHKLCGIAKSKKENTMYSIVTYNQYVIITLYGV